LLRQELENQNSDSYSDISLPNVEDDEFTESDRPQNYKMDLQNIESISAKDQSSAYYTSMKSSFSKNLSEKLQAISSKTEELKCWLNRTESLICCSQSNMTEIEDCMVDWVCLGDLKDAAKM